MTASQTLPSPQTQAGMAALQRGDLETALAQFAQASRDAPADIGLLRTLAALYQHAGLHAEAWSAAETGLALLPRDAGFGIARIAALGGAGFVDAALTLARALLRDLPQEPALLLHYGTLLLQRNDAAGARQAAETALARQPDLPALLSLGAEAAFRQGDHAVARARLDRAIALEPQNRALRLARATMLLSLGDWAGGLPDYEYRLLPDATREIVRQGLDLPRWQGEDIQNRHLLVVSEQGVGDQMRFVRDILAVRPLCARLTVECAPRLVPLFARSLPGDVQVMAAAEMRDGRRHIFGYGWIADHNRPDCYIEAGSLMLRLFERGKLPA